jgi:phage shock protein A
MPLLDRVATLIKANLNDLVDKAEDPEKLLKQLLLDMQNQYMQVKTQVAIAIADQHLLEKKQQENIDAQKDWVRKAELAVAKNEEDLARIALERSLTYENAAKFRTADRRSVATGADAAGCAASAGAEDHRDQGQG